MKTFAIIATATVLLGAAAATHAKEPASWITVTCPGKGQLRYFGLGSESAERCAAWQPEVSLEANPGVGHLEVSPTTPTRGVGTATAMHPKGWDGTVKGRELEASASAMVYHCAVAHCRKGASFYDVTFVGSTLHAQPFDCRTQGLLNIPVRATSVESVVTAASASACPVGVQRREMGPAPHHDGTPSQ